MSTLKEFNFKLVCDGCSYTKEITVSALDLHDAYHSLFDKQDNDSTCFCGHTFAVYSTDGYLLYDCPCDDCNS